MPEDRSARGVPVPAVWQWLVAAGAVCTVWLLWLELRKPQADGAGRGTDGDQRSAAAVFENLRTVEAIAQTGAEGVPELVAALAHSDPRLRRNALFALRLIGPEAGEAIPVIRERLIDENGQVRSYAIDAYWHIRRDPGDVASVVAPLLADPDASVREAAAKVLDIIGRPAIGSLVALLKTQVPAARVPAVKVLGRIGWDEDHPQVDQVLRELANVADSEARLESMTTLAAWGHPTSSEVRELLQQKGARETALRAIIRLGPAAAENLNDVLDVLAENGTGEPSWASSREWDSALAALRAMQGSARPASSRLLQIANENRNYRCIDIGWVLFAIGADPQDIVRISTPLLLDKDTDLCFHAGRLCAIASPDDSRRQVTRLIPQLAPEKLADGRSALHAVWGMAPEAREAIPVMSRLLECGQPHVARVAAKTLGDIGADAASAIPDLTAQLARGRDAHDYWARSAFCEAIGKMGPAAHSAVPALLVELNDAPLSRSGVRDVQRAGERPVQEALLALARIGDREAEVLKAIRRHVDNDDAPLRDSATAALVRLTLDSSEVLTDYLKSLNDAGNLMHNPVVAILEIGRLPGDRQNAVIPLAGLLVASDLEIRKAAAWSLGKIGPEAGTALPLLKEARNDWKNSLFSRGNGHFPKPPSLADNPRIRLEAARWGGLDDAFMIQREAFSLRGKSVKQVIDEAIAAIEADSDESGSLPVRK
jgi:HEAT repeat protein